LLSDVWIFDKKLHKRVDAFHLALLDIADDTLLPELYELLGEEKTMVLLTRFAGTTIRVPKEQVLRDAARNADIYMRVQAGETLDSLATKNGLKVEEVAAIERRLRSALR
jgi:Mor family transcriptional regulator